MPGPAPCRADASRVQGLSNGAAGFSSAGLYLTGDRQYIRGKSLGPGSVGNSAKGLSLAQIGPVPRRCALRLLGCSGGAGAVCNHAPLFLGQGGIDVQHEGVSIRAQLGHYERHALRHHARDKRHVPAQAAQLGNHDSGLRPAGLCQGSGQHWAAVQSTRYARP